MKAISSSSLSKILPLLFLLLSSEITLAGGSEPVPPSQVSTAELSEPVTVKKGRLRTFVSSMRNKQERRAMIKDMRKALKDDGGSGLGTWALMLVAAGIFMLLMTFLAAISALFWPGVIAILLGIILGFSARGDDKKAGSVAAGIGITILIVLVGLVVLLLAALYIILEGLGF